MEPRRRRPSFPGYGVPDTGEGMLPWSWAVERLEAARNYWVSTTRPNGSPHAMPVWGVWLEDAFFFGSERRSAKSRNLEANPGIVVHLESGDQTVILEGHAEPVRGDELTRRIDEVYGPKYNWGPSEDDDTPWWEVRPRRAYAWTERGFPGDATEFRWE
jgi:Pyridoxamine 5'-phosphate oxidase